MQRSNLVEAAKRAISWFSGPPKDEKLLKTLFSPHLSVPYPQLGSRGDLEGLVELCGEAWKAAPSAKFTARFMVVDESECRIVLMTNFAGTLTRYPLYCHC